MVTIQSPYEQCPVIIGDNVELRLIRIEDAGDLLRCYSDPKAQLLFNADNCTNKFQYATREEMKNAIAFWLEEYQRKYYVRFSILDHKSGHAIGTVEMFTKPANDGATPIGVLRIDLQSSFESETTLDELVQVIETNFPKHFSYTAIVTKIVKIAEKRQKVFQSHGFVPLQDQTLINFDDYYVKYY
jgi:hypothetical protein